MTELSLIRLSNGLRVALDPMPGFETAAIGVWQSVGTRWECAEENGVAHLFEHMAFKGAGGRDARQFAEAIENVGGHMNAATSYERTAYFARIVAEQAPFALDLLADIMLEPHWAPEDLDKEKNVVAQERGEAFDQAEDRVFELHQAALYADQALGRPILGKEESVGRIGVETLEAFREAHLTPERIVIAIAGGFDADAILDKAEARFGGLIEKPKQYAAPAQARPGVSYETRKLEQAHLVFSWPGVAAASEDAMAMRLLAEVFGGGMASRLFQEVREKRGLVYAIDAFADAIEDDGRLMVYAGCGASKADEVARIVVAELEALASKGPSPAELARAKAIAGGQLLMGLEAPSARAEARASQTFLRDRLFRLPEMRGKVEAVSAADIQRLAAAALHGARVAAGVGPRKGHGALDAFHAA